MTPRFPPPPWFSEPSHRTLAEVAETRELEMIMRKLLTTGERARLAELRARAVEPDRDDGGAAA